MEPINAIDFEKAGGLVTAITVDDATGDVLMVAYMNPESFRRTLEIGEVVYWSRCDGDAVLLRVEQRGGAACHTGKRSCFYRKLAGGEWVDVGEQVFDPDEVYGS